MTNAATFAVQNRQIAIQYNGTNSDQIMSYLTQADQVLVSEQNGVMHTRTSGGWGDNQINTGDWIIIQLSTGGANFCGVATAVQMPQCFLNADGTTFTG